VQKKIKKTGAEKQRKTLRKTLQIHMQREEGRRKVKEELKPKKKKNREKKRTIPEKDKTDERVQRKRDVKNRQGGDLTGVD